MTAVRAVGAAKSMDALLARLASDTPDLDAILKAAAIVAASLRRRPRRESPRVTIAERDRRRLRVFRRCVLHETIDDWIVASVEQHPPAFHETWTADGSIVVAEIDRDGDESNNTTFEWRWREVADGLSAAIRALPSRARIPKPTRCPYCHKEFVP